MYTIKPAIDLVSYLLNTNHIGHRSALADAGYTRKSIADAVRRGWVVPIRRHWVALESVDDDLLAAASASSRLTCISLARRRGWWMPDRVERRLHLTSGTHGRGAENARMHWSKPLTPAPAWSLLDSIENALAAIALCQPPEAAVVLWEAAIRAEHLSLDALRRIRWPSGAAAHFADVVRGLSDSGIETIFARRLRHLGVPIVLQAIIAGHRVDALIGDLLVVQIDGYEFHSSSAQRTRDVDLDAELTLRGYTVLHFTYAQIVHDWSSVERRIARAIAAGLHRTR